MRVVVAAVIEREDRRLLIGQRRRDDTSPLKWEFPGGKVEEGERPQEALARELREELGVTLIRSVPIGSVKHQYAGQNVMLEIQFYGRERAARREPRDGPDQARGDPGTGARRTGRITCSTRGLRNDRI